MCDYCGCQAVSVIEELTEEHDQVVALISNVRTAHESSDVEELARLARMIAAVLDDAADTVPTDPGWTDRLLETMHLLVGTAADFTASTYR